MAALVSEVHGIVPWGEEWEGDGAVGCRVGLLTRVQEGLYRMSRVAIQPCNFHTTGRQSSFMCQWSYVESKEARVNRYYTAQFHPLIAEVYLDAYAPVPPVANRL